MMPAVRWFCWQTTATRFVFVVALANAALYHLPLFSFTVTHIDSFSFNAVLIPLTLFAVIALATAMALLTLALLTVRLIKPACMLMAMGNSIALYFVSTYQVVLDKSMMGNVFNTNFEEAFSYLHPNLFVYMLVFGVLPSLLVVSTRIQSTGRRRVALHVLLTILAGLVCIYLSSSTWLWIDKNAKKLGGMVMPWSYVVNMLRYQSEEASSSRVQTLLPPATFLSDERTVVILVIGEAARAQNFSLYGYGRPTNPRLTELGVIALKNSVACATYTTASLRCILSHTDSASEFSRRYEPLPSYLQRNGVDVIWRTNNWGEPKIQVQSYQRLRELGQDCRDAGCKYDEGLLRGLSERIRSSKRHKVFVVLHQRGSHGPSYYTEYPQRFEVFKPVCRSVELNDCTPEELINAYDNTILYTDHVLGEGIDLLKGLTDTATVLMYISDHGESLGEHSLYLHGTPYTIAPDVQKEVPFLLWMSRTFMDSNGISKERIGQRDGYSQANVFHSVMGAFDMRSDAYDPALDIFSDSPVGD